MNGHAQSTITILVVDDERSICEVLNQYLTRIGYVVALARSGEEALEILSRQHVDMVLSDIKMPGISGVDLLKKIKEHNRSIPVLLTTGFPTLDTAIEALKLGAFDYLTKPFHLEEIGEKIKRALASKRMQEENLLLTNLVSLHELTRGFSTTHDPVELNARVLDSCSSMVEANGGALIYYDAMASATPAGTVGEFDAAFFTKPFFRDCATLALERGTPLMIPSKTGAQDVDMSAVAHQIDSCIVYPLKTSSRTLGTLALVRRANSRKFSDLDLEIVKVLALQAGISLENARLYQNIRDNYLKTIRGFALAVEAKDRYTHGHSENVMKYVGWLARNMGLAETDIEQMKSAGLLHDIGKIGVSDLILNKPGKLTMEEFEEIKRHPELGARIIADVPFLKSLVPLVLHHHEFFDGSGYPEGIKGEQIPLGARILCVCDAYEAMTSDRPYRKAMPVETAFKILDENKGRQFDADVVKVFLEGMKSGGPV